MELLAPAGNFETALVAFANGADAVYAGMNAFSARAEADNFDDTRMRTLVDYAHARGKKVYITFNTVIDDANLPEAIEKLAVLEDIAPDGIIVQDLGVAKIVKEHFPSLELHASTQLVAHNLEGVLAMKELGFVRVVLARELSLAEIALIKERSGVEIEVFVHGALCYSLSGLCLFSAMENNRSGNRGRCAYCCRLSYCDSSGARSLPFSMRDLRLDDTLRALRDAGVDSAKIEGRMKSPIYVASVTKRYRQLLDGEDLSQIVTQADLETVFSRRTTSLYVKDPEASPETIIDPESLGHLGTPIGRVKRITKDRDNRSWLRFHTTRNIEKHDGLQFLAQGGKPFGFGIIEMRKAISRNPVFEAFAGDDVEVLVPQDRLVALSKIQGPDPLSQGSIVFCSASNAVKRRFPIPPFRPSETQSRRILDVKVTLKPEAIVAEAEGVTISKEASLEKASHPEKTEDAVKKAFLRMGEAGWALGKLELEDEEKLFAPPSILNEARRTLIEKVSLAKDVERQEKIKRIVESLSTSKEENLEDDAIPTQNIKLRLSQTLPDDEKYFDEIIFAIGRASAHEASEKIASFSIKNLEKIRLSLPVFTQEKDFANMRRTVKQLAKSGFKKWEASDLATLRLLKNCGIEDVTADWTLYAFNSKAAEQLQSLGVKRAVASPENNHENLKTLAGLELTFEFLDEQSTPLFISLTRPMAKDPTELTGLKGDKFTSFEMDNLWITTRPEPRTFTVPANAKAVRSDISWNP
jgi:putative protease